MPTWDLPGRKVSNYHKFRNSADDTWLSNYSTFQLYLANATAISILRSVKEQEAHFEELTQALDIERQCVANQLEKYKNSQELGSLNSLTSLINESTEEKEFFNFYKLSPLSSSIDSILRKPNHHPEMADTHHLQSQDVAPQESYSVSYQMLTTTNGHNNIDEGSLGGGGGDISPGSSQLSVGGGMSENAQLISRSTAQTKTQQVKTVTKVITTREVRHIGPDGLPMDYPPPGSIYGSVGGGPAVPGGDYGTYPYTGTPVGGHDYGTYDSGRPPSPGGQVPPHAYVPGDYGSSHYGSTPSPAGQNIGSPRNYDYYSPHPGGAPPHHPKYPGDYRDYQDYPTQPPSPPSATSESPPPRRAVPQAPRTVDGLGAAPDARHLGMPPTQGYEDLGPPMGPGSLHRSSLYHPSPSPGPGDMYSPYGYAPGPQMTPPTSTGLPNYSPFEVAPPQGYLDRRPSYDDHPQNQQPNSRPNVTYGTAQHPGSTPTVYNDAPSLLPPDDPSQLLQHPLNAQPRHSPHPLDFDHMGEGENRDVRWRDPDLHEVIEFLGHPNNVVRANAAAYLQHLCFMDDNMKQKTRALGGIPPLIELVSQEIPEIQRNACGALRNLSYGRQNDENKRAFRNAGGIPTLVRLLRKTPDNEIRELVTGILWNLSSCEDLKRPIIDDALSVLVNHIIIPQSGWDRHRDPNDAHQVSSAMKGQEIYWSTVFRNASGVLRNVSSAGEYARRKLRECEGLVDALLHLVRAAIGKNDMDNKSVENCICILRNLSYRCQEVEDPDYDRHAPPSSTATSPQSRAVAGLKAVGDNLGCFGASKKKKELAQNASSSGGAANQTNRKDGGPTSPSGVGASGGPLGANNTPSRPRSDPPRGMELLWQPEVVQPYLALLSECSNPETLEAAAGAIQNLAACYWQPSVDVRAAVRKEKGLPILVELLRMEVDRVVCAVATALRNLAMDHRNKELIGKHAMEDLVKKLPNGDPQHDAGTSDDTIAAVLATLNEVIVKNCDFAHSLLEARGVQRLTFLMKQRGRYSPRVVKFASQLLYNMWQHQELRDVYKKAGWKESHFVSRSMMSANRNAANYAGGKGTNSTSSSPASSANNTLNRPISTQGGTKYEDRTLPRGGNRDQNNSLGMGGHHETSNQHMGTGYYGQNADEMPLSDLGGHEVPQSTQPLHRPPVGGVPIFPPGPTGGMGSGGVHLPMEPVYAQVNRGEKKKNRHHPSEMSSQAMLLDHEASAAAGDSWV